MIWKSKKTFNFIPGTSENEDLFSGEEVSSSTNQSFNVGEWALDPFEGQKLLQFDEDTVKISWPKTQDILEIDFADNSIKKLTEPSFDKRMHCTFLNINFS